MEGDPVPALSFDSLKLPDLRRHQKDIRSGRPVYRRSVFQLFKLSRVICRLGRWPWPRSVFQLFKLSRVVYRRSASLSNRTCLFIQNSACQSFLKTSSFRVSPRTLIARVSLKRLNFCAAVWLVGGCVGHRWPVFSRRGRECRPARIAKPGKCYPECRIESLGPYCVSGYMRRCVRCRSQARASTRFYQARPAFPLSLVQPCVFGSSFRRPQYRCSAYGDFKAASVRVDNIYGIQHKG